jgi:hypothetical protein
MKLATLQETKSTIRFSAKLFRPKATENIGSWTLLKTKKRWLQRPATIRNLKFFLDADLKYEGTSPLISTIGLCRKKQSQGRVAKKNHGQQRYLRSRLMIWPHL